MRRSRPVLLRPRDRTASARHAQRIRHPPRGAARRAHTAASRSLRRTASFRARDRGIVSLNTLLNRRGPLHPAWLTSLARATPLAPLRSRELLRGHYDYKTLVSA